MEENDSHLNRTTYPREFRNHLSANDVYDVSMSARLLRWRKDRKTISYEDAVWQYFLDHARAVDSGGYVFMMPILKNKEDLTKRIKSRQEGKYRYTEEDLLRQNPVVKRIKKRNWRKTVRKILHWLIQRI